MPNDLIIGNRITFKDPVRIRAVSNLRCSWEISKLGMLTCDVPMADLPPSLLPEESMLRKWVKFEHPTAGLWGGLVQSVTNRNGIITLDCESWAAMLKGVLSIDIGGMKGAVTGLRAAIETAATKTGIKWGTIAEPSPTEPDRYTIAYVVVDADFFYDGQDLYDELIPAVMDEMYLKNAWRSSLRSLAWNIDPETRAFNIDYTYGRDLTKTVQLKDRVHNLDSGWTDDVDDITNSVIYTGNIGTEDKSKPLYGDPEKQKDGTVKPGPIIGYATISTPTTIKVINSASIAQYGLREAVYEETTNVVFADDATMRTRAQQLTATLSRNEQLVTVECADVGGIWSQFREGDIIGVDLSNSGRTGNMVARARAYDSTRDTMIVSGEANLA